MDWMYWVNIQFMNSYIDVDIETYEWGIYSLVIYHGKKTKKNMFRNL